MVVDPLQVASFCILVFGFYYYLFIFLSTRGWAVRRAAGQDWKGRLMWVAEGREKGGDGREKERYQGTGEEDHREGGEF